MNVSFFFYWHLFGIKGFPHSFTGSQSIEWNLGRPVIGARLLNQTLGVGQCTWEAKALGWCWWKTKNVFRGENQTAEAIRLKYGRNMTGTIYSNQTWVFPSVTPHQCVMKYVDGTGFNMLQPFWKRCRPTTWLRKDPFLHGLNILINPARTWSAWDPRFMTAKTASTMPPSRDETSSIQSLGGSDRRSYGYEFIPYYMRS